MKTKEVEFQLDMNTVMGNTNKLIDYCQNTLKVKPLEACAELTFAAITSALSAMPDDADFESAFDCAKKDVESLIKSFEDFVRSEMKSNDNNN